MKTYKIIVAILFSVGIVSILAGTIIGRQNLKHDARSNTSCTTNQRVFDYNEVMSNSEEAELESLIKKYEEKTGMDIVVITVDNASAQSMFGTYDDNTYYGEFDAIRTVADSFCEQYRFGWEEWEYNPSDIRSTADGYVPSDSIVIAANWEAGDIWMSTSGTRVRERISNSKAESLVNDGGEYLRSDPVKGFSVMIKGAVRCMKSSSGSGFHMSPIVVIVVVAIGTICFVIANMSKKAGEKTVAMNTYVDGNVNILDRRDIFIRKNVTSVKIESSSGGGGGTSGGGGGGSHGGGGGHF